MAVRVGRRPNSGFYGLVIQKGPWPTTRADGYRHGGYQADNTTRVAPYVVRGRGSETGLSEIAQRRVVDNPVLISDAQARQRPGQFAPVKVAGKHGGTAYETVGYSQVSGAGVPPEVLPVQGNVVSPAGPSTQLALTADEETAVNMAPTSSAGSSSSGSLHPSAPANFEVDGDFTPSAPPDAPPAYVTIVEDWNALERISNNDAIVGEQLPTYDNAGDILQAIPNSPRILDRLRSLAVDGSTKAINLLGVAFTYYVLQTANDASMQREAFMVGLENAIQYALPGASVAGIAAYSQEFRTLLRRAQFDWQNFQIQIIRDGGAVGRRTIEGVQNLLLTGPSAIPTGTVGGDIATTIGAIAANDRTAQQALIWSIRRIIIFLLQSGIQAGLGGPGFTRGGRQFRPDRYL